MGGHHHQHDSEQHAGYAWLFFCIFGMMSSLTLYGLVLEYVTSNGRKLHELSFVFVTTTIYSITAYIMRIIFNEKVTTIKKSNMMFLSFTSLISTYTSIRSLRYVIYPVQVLFKSCKPVPVMLFGFFLGKKYPLRKIVNVMIITIGVSLFMGAGSSSKGHDSTTEATGLSGTLIGAIMLSISLCFDGATGAYEDKLMAKHSVGPFELMYNIQLGKAVISFCCLLITNNLLEFFNTLADGGIMLIVLGLTGALGQVFVFLTISKFGALNCSLIGLFRKIFSLFLSFFLYGHTVNVFQFVGLILSLSAMIFNFIDKGGKKKESSPSSSEIELNEGKKVGLDKDDVEEDLEALNPLLDNKEIESISSSSTNIGTTSSNSSLNNYFSKTTGSNSLADSKTSPTENLLIFEDNSTEKAYNSIPESNDKSISI